MDIIDKIFNRIPKAEAPGRLRAQILAIPETTVKRSGFGFRVMKFALPVLLLAVVAGGVYFQYFRTAHLAAAFELTAEQTDPAGITPTSTFILKSSVKLSDRQIRQAVHFDPEVEFDIESAGENAYRLRPSGELPQNQILKVTIAEGVGDRDYNWAYQVKAPFQVLGTVPGDASSYVPTNTGIEITFNRESFIEPEKYFSITPEVVGSFEQYGQILIFKPKQPLKEKTVYTVTIKAGMKISNSEDVLTKDHQFKFETGTQDYSQSNRLMLAQDFSEFPGGKPVYNAFQAETDSTATIYQFKNVDDFAQHYIKSRPWDLSWTSFNKDPQKLSLNGLQKVLEFKPVWQKNEPEYQYSAEAPQDLKAGYYVTEFVLPNKTFVYSWMQVTPLANYTSITGQNGIVWLYDFTKHQPIADASVALVSGAKLGQTNGDGLAQFNTPQSILDDNQKTTGYATGLTDPEILRIEKQGYNPYLVLAQGYGWFRGLEKGSKYWESLSTDRPFYQLTDSIKYWGVLEPRDNKKLESKEVSVELYAGNYWWYGPGKEDKPLAKAKAEVQSSGTYSGTLDFAGLAAGDYTLIAKVGDESVSQTNIRAFTYSKPAYQISVEADKDAHYTDEQIVYKVKANFYDGTPVRNLSLKYSGYWDSTIEGIVTTNDKGEGEVKVTLPYNTNVPYAQYTNWPRGFYLNFTPEKQEEGVIRAAVAVNIFGPRVTMRVESTIKQDKTNVFTASVHAVDINKSQGPQVYSQNYEGDPQKNHVVSATIKRIAYTKNQVGEYYDYINKVTQPKYEYKREDKVVETISGRTNDQGQWVLEKKYPFEENVYYEILFETADSGKRVNRTTLYYSYYDYRSLGWSDNPNQYNTDLQPQLVLRPENGNQYQNEFSVGETIPLNVKFNNPNAKLPNKEPQVLFYAIQRSIVKTKVVSGLTSSDVFDQSYAPGVEYRAVLVGPNGFEETYGTQAVQKKKDVELTIDVQADKAAYRPGEEVSLVVRVKDAKGKSHAAALSMAVVDEALFAVGESYQSSTLEDIYQQVTVQPLIHYTRYIRPQGNDGGGGGGGGETGRSSFKDTAFYKTIDVGDNGEARVIFKLPDNITSWRVTTRGFAKDGILAGTSIKNVTSGLPFFVETTLSPTYLVNDEPSMRLRLAGTEYKSGKPTEISITSEKLKLEVKKTVSNDLLFVELPKLPAGIYDIAIEVKQEGKADKLVRRISVLPTYFTAPKSKTYALTNELSDIEASETGITKIVFTDTGKAAMIPTLSWLSYQNGLRIDQRAPANFAQAALHDHFGIGDAPAAIDLSSFLKTDPGRDNVITPTTGLSLVTYGSVDLTASAYATSLLPNSVPKLEMTRYFNRALIDERNDIHRTSIALLGLASLKQPVLAKLQTLATDDELSLEDKLVVAHGLIELGDYETARALYSKDIGPNLITEGNISYLKDGDQTRTVKVTGKAGIVATALQIEPDAERIWNYLQTHYPEKDLDSFERALIVKFALDSKDQAQGSFHYKTTLNEGTVELKNGQSKVLEMLRDEVKSIRFDSVKGSVQAVVLYEGYEDPSTMQPNPNVQLTRRYDVNGRAATTFKDGQIVKVVLTMNPKYGQYAGAYQVTDYLPSGLKPVVDPFAFGFYPPYESDPCRRSYWYPDTADGNRISFTAYPDERCKNIPIEISYYARVVSTGTFSADPAFAAPLNEIQNATVTKKAIITITP